MSIANTALLHAACRRLLDVKSFGGKLLQRVGWVGVKSKGRARTQLRNAHEISSLPVPPRLSFTFSSRSRTTSEQQKGNREATLASSPFSLSTLSSAFGNIDVELVDATQASPVQHHPASQYSNAYPAGTPCQCAGQGASMGCNCKTGSGKGKVRSGARTCLSAKKPASAACPPRLRKSARSHKHWQSLRSMPFALIMIGLAATFPNRMCSSPRRNMSKSKLGWLLLSANCPVWFDCRTVMDEAALAGVARLEVEAEAIGPSVVGGVAPFLGLAFPSFPSMPRSSFPSALADLCFLAGLFSGTALASVALVWAACKKSRYFLTSKCALIDGLIQSTLLFLLSLKDSHPASTGCCHHLPILVFRKLSSCSCANACSAKLALKLPNNKQVTCSRDHWRIVKN